MAKRGRPKKIQSAVAEVSPFTIDIKLGTEQLHGEGDSVLAALQSIPKPIKIITKGIITVTNGELRTERLMQPIQLKRLFYPIAQPLQAKYLVFGLKKYVLTRTEVTG